MINIPFNKELLTRAEKTHIKAIVNFVNSKNDTYKKQLFEEITAVQPYSLSYDDICHVMDDNHNDKRAWGWLEKFILMSVSQLKTLVSNSEAVSKLNFMEFKWLYENRFSNGAGVYVDGSTKYNSYSFVRNLDIRVCPYCDEEFLYLFENDEGEFGKASRKTLEIDHFFPKSVYPALAMCFYNLVPCGHACNNLKLAEVLEMSPYEPDIEQCTNLCPDLPIGINLESISSDQINLDFHSVGGMERNVDVLRLEDRYNKAHKNLAYKYLKCRQNFTEEKIERMVKDGYFTSVKEAREIILNEPEHSEHSILQKLRKDILGE